MAQSGNGIDGTIYDLLTRMSARLDSIEARMDQLLAVVNDHSRILGDHSRILGDHSRRFDDLDASMAELRTSVSLYHDAVTSQGIHYSDIESRVLRIERHLKLDPAG